MFSLVPLFGGAIECEMPQNFVDISNFRQIPDHQEVYADASTDRSIIIDINERSNECSDENSAKWYFNFISDRNQSQETNILTHCVISDIQAPNLIGLSKTFATGRQLVSKGRDNPNAANTIELFVAVIRLGTPYNADIVISYNIPIHISLSSQVLKDGPLSSHSATDNQDIINQILLTFKIKDMKLFII